MTNMNQDNTQHDHGAPVLDDAAHVPLSLMTRPEDLPEATDVDPDGGIPQFKGINRGTLLIVGLLLLGAAVIYFMRAGQEDFKAAVSDGQLEARIEEALAKLTQPQSVRDDDPLLQKNLKELFQDTEAIVTMFSSDPSEHQVPIEFIKKNPFQIGDGAANPNAGQLGQVDSSRKLASELKRLKLQSIVNGRMPIAMINDQMCRVGDSVGSFQIVAIHGDQLTVDLEAQGESYVLAMENNSNSTGVNRQIFESNP